MKFYFDLYSTNVAKGIAICLVLLHHLAGHVGFPLQNYGTVAVVMFVFLSGFGLMKADEGKGISLVIRTTIYRLLRLYANFLFVALIFFLLSSFVFGRGVQVVYPIGWFPAFIMDLLCLRGSNAYNPTWWFISVIVMLYICYIFMRMLIEKCNLAWGGVVLLSLSNLFWFVDVRPGVWLLPFVLGMLFARCETLQFKNTKVVAFVLLGMLLVVAWIRVYCLGRLSLALINVQGVLLIFLTCGIADLARRNVLGRIIHFIGKHSMNLFLLHTFVYLYFFPNLFRRMPLIVGLLLLGISSLLCSFAIEKLKMILSFERGMQFLRLKVCEQGEM